jgi:hypothetical protein
MKKFLFEFILSLIVLFISLYFIFSFFDGTYDTRYLRFTTKKKESLILGGSRSASAINPEILFEKDLCNSEPLNFSFTARLSPYGPSYYNCIERKLKKGTTDGLFIVSVNPRLISSKSNDPNNPELFREKNSVIGEITFVNQNPNFDYLLNFSEISLIEFFTKEKPEMLLHKNGWIEFSEASDSVRTVRSQKTFKKLKRKTDKISSLRIEYLKKTINFLKQHGKVYLVRIPAEKEFLVYEDSMMPDFNNLMERISSELNVPFIDFTPAYGDYTYRDGSHMSASSAIKFTAVMADTISRISEYRGK